ncbi:MAG: zinc ribbon domain-containing protein [Halorubrum sp.]|uniref:DUF7577 domain-containing protein n=1 Tax=Halorubrum sp. TaxID=1879286 RepID=UPI003970F637
MIDVGPIYLAIAGALLLFALALGFRVLRDIVREGRDRRRRRRAGELEKYTEDQEYGGRPPVGSGADRGEANDPDAPDDRTDPGTTCPKCGAANEPGFNYCRRCTAPLRSGT